MKPLDRFSCEEIFRRLDDYIDRELSDDEVRKVEEHLSACAECAGEYRFEASLIEELKAKLRRIAVPPTLFKTISAAIDRVGSLDRSARRDGGPPI